MQARKAVLSGLCLVSVVSVHMLWSATAAMKKQLPNRCVVLPPSESICSYLVRWVLLMLHQAAPITHGHRRRLFFFFLGQRTNSLPSPLLFSFHPPPPTYPVVEMKQLVLGKLAPLCLRRRLTVLTILIIIGNLYSLTT